MSALSGTAVASGLMCDSDDPVKANARAAFERGDAFVANPYPTEHEEYEWWGYCWMVAACDVATAEGAKARFLGELQSVCPYTSERDGDRYGAWLKGWEEARPLPAMQGRVLRELGALGSANTTSLAGRLQSNNLAVTAACRALERKELIWGVASSRGEHATLKWLPRD